jgi:hypothetical protein
MKQSRPVPVLKVTRHGKAAADGSKRGATPPSPDLERIRARAYHIWEQEGRPHGRDEQHWQEAERQLAVEFRIGYPDATGTDFPSEEQSGELAKPGDLDVDDSSRLSH